MELRGIVDPDVDPLVPGGRQLIRLARAGAARDEGTGPLEEVAEVLGAEAAVKGASVAAAFEVYNRLVDAIGLSMARPYRARLQDIVDELDLTGLPHAD